MGNSNNSKKKEIDSKAEDKKSKKKLYDFGEIKEYSLEKIEDEILNESLYLDVFAGSDITFKDNIQNIDLVLPKLLSLSCISYDYKNSEFKDKNFPKSRQLGVIANEIEKVFPELVKKDQEGYLYVNYSQLSTIAIQAVKELYTSLTQTNNRVNKLEIKINKILKDK